ncbi:MAG: hypothetical protein ACO3NK_07795 [Prochlorotrichaceae cyanobacterium]
MTRSFIPDQNTSRRSSRNRTPGTSSRGKSPATLRRRNTPSTHAAAVQSLPVQPRSKLPSRSPSPRRRSRRFYYLTVISEASLKILINALLLSAFAVALGRLLPQMWRNNQQRVAIETELEMTQARVDGLEERFSQTFAPQTSFRIIEDQRYQVDPQKRRVVFLDKATETSPQE